MKEVGLLLDPKMREAVNEVRRHKRRLQRTRAAERERDLSAAGNRERRTEENQVKCLCSLVFVL